MFNIQEIFSQMTLREKIGQTFLQYYQGYDDMPEALIEMNKKNELGGIIFFSGNNVRNIEQLHEMCRNIKAHASENKYKLPILLTIDQEGGQLTAVHKGTTMFPGNMAMGFANDQNMAYEQGKHVAKELKYAGIDLCYAPVLDVSYDRVNGIPVVDNRTYSSNPEVVASMGAGFIKGLQEGGVMACGKHFPGMRLTAEDTHFKMDRHSGSFERLEKVELLPFKKAIEEGLDCIMMHHGIFEALDKEKPASLSEKVIGYLRHYLGFGGLIVTDDLIMKAVLDAYGEKDALVCAMNAGCDLLISTCAGPWYIDFMEECVNTGKVSMGRIDEACLKILKYKAKYACEPIPEEKGFDKKEGDQVAYKIAKKSLILYKGKREEFPIKLGKNDKLGIIFGNPARLVMSDAINLYDKLSIEDILRKSGYHDNIKEVIMPWRPTYMEMVSVGDIAIISDVVLFTTVNAYHFTEQIETIKYIRAFCPDKKIIGVATRSPEDAEILARYCDDVIVTGGLTSVTLIALIETLFGDGKFDFNEAKAEVSYGAKK
ncbi:MAG: glycoside hydrolase family 3 protein [Clostridia bacterium]|jgi:beta-N-acetylhexosaminidase|nr:glycoside hydrolase family 3 protein [Clostridia bacterium]